MMHTGFRQKKLYSFTERNLIFFLLYSKAMYLLLLLKSLKSLVWIYYSKNLELKLWFCNLKH